MANGERKREYAEMTPEELERRLGETFFCPDQIDETVFRELEELLEALDEKQPLEEDPDPEAGWQRFLRDRAEELAECFAPDVPVPAGPEKKRSAAGPAEEGRRPRTIFRAGVLRRVLIAAAVVALMTGAVLAAGHSGLLAWTPKWNATAGRYEAVGEKWRERPIPAALKELGITEPVYPPYLPEGFVITESHISEDPLFLMEQYARGDQHISITVAPILGVKNTVYTRGRETIPSYAAGETVHYLFANEGTVTAVWYTEHYASTISGDIRLSELKDIILSLYDESEGGNHP